VKFSPYCEKNLPMQTTFHPNYDKKRNDSSNFINLPDKFLITFIGTAGLMLFFFFDWITIQIPLFVNAKTPYDFTIHGFSIFSINTQFNEFENAFLYFFYDEAKNILTFLDQVSGFLFILLMIAIGLFISSLIGYKLKNRLLLAYVGFILSTVVTSTFIVCIFCFNLMFADYTSGYFIVDFTIFPFIALVLSIISLILIIKRSSLISI
jgi:hypothetical protein